MAKDPNISDIFYYFEQFSTLQTGRTIGRKIGVMQEVMLRKYLIQSPEIADRILLEHSIQGHSGATHKMEFLICNIADKIQLTTGEPVQYGGIELQLTAHDNDSATISARWLDEDKTVKRVSVIQYGSSFKSKPLMLRLAREGLVARLIQIAADSVEIALIEPNTPLASIESKRVGAQRFSKTDKLGAGIQTIEKAKQAALVALDTDLHFNKTIKPRANSEELRRYISFVVLGNGIHWEPKSRKVMLTYIDHVYQVPDASIIRYCDYVKDLANQAGEEFLSFYMKYFTGMTIMEGDSFQVSDADFVSISGKLPLSTVIENHIEKFNSL